MRFTEAERPIGERLLKSAAETDRIEGYFEPHSTRIAELSETFARTIGISGQDLTALKFAALAHDIGVKSIERSYLLKQEDLSWDEKLDLWRHPILGEQAAVEIGLPRQSQLLIRWHHEWWDGSGYPDGLSMDSIPLAARLLRLVDTWCALTSDRPRRKSYEISEARRMITENAGLEFDPQLVTIFMAMNEETVAKERGISISANERFAPPVEDATTSPVRHPAAYDTSAYPADFIKSTEEQH